MTEVIKIQWLKLSLPDRIAILMILTGAILILARLGDRVLWEDEGETAVLAVNVLKYGYPRVYDGRNLITQDNGNRYTEGFPIFGREYNEHYAECYHPWLQHYIAAGSIALFGRNSLGARLPFALLGIAGLAVSWWVTRKLFQDPWLAALTAVLLAVHVPYILHMRQCRYYPLLPIFTIGLVYFYIGVNKQWRRSAIGFTLCAILLFHSHYLVFGCTFLALLVHFILFERNWKIYCRFIIPTLIIVAFTLPWFLYAQPYNHTTPTGSLEIFKYRLYTYATLINHGVFPFLFLPLLILLFIQSLKESRENYSLYSLFVILIIVVALGQTLNLTATRNLMGVVPLGVILIAACIRIVWRQYRIVAVILFILSSVTDIPAYTFRYLRSLRTGDADSFVRDVKDFPDWSEPIVWGSSLAAYLFEITHEFDGPKERIIDYLRKHAHPDDVVLTNYDWEIIIFHTGLRVANRLTDPSHPDFEKTHFEWKDIDWVITRKFWPTLPEMFPADWEERLKLDYIPIDLGVRDVPWNGTPQFHYHQYVTPPGDDIILFQRKAMTHG